MENYVFMTRSFWLELSVPQNIVRKKYKEYFGEKHLDFMSRSSAAEYLISVTAKIQDKMMHCIKNGNACYLIRDLYKILDESFHFYMRQKETRKKMCELNIQDSSILDVFEENRNKSCCVIDAVNLWLENCTLLHNNVSDCKDEFFEQNNELFVEMYIYGLASQALSLITMSKKFDEQEMFIGINVRPDEEVPIQLLKNHPVIYFNTAMVGNQNVLIRDNELAKADESLFGKGFYETYGIHFIFSLRILSTFQAVMLNYGKYALTVIDKEQFISEINRYGNGCINADKFFEAFVLTKEKIKTQVKKKDPIIWIMKSNKYRHELRPFICLDNNRIYISFCALEQAKRLWCSIFLNGGMCYSNSKDSFTISIERKNEELSDRLVEILREKLREHYEASFDEKDVRYDRIFGAKEIDYGDFDVMFYAPSTKELFLIEAKFFSDSLSSSGIISDYEKMFKKAGYYEHCRGRYDLCLREKGKIKSFIGVPDSEVINVHFLFVSSKPLEIDFQDKDGVVTFLCLSIFDKYLDGKLLPEVGNIPIRPTHEF